MTRLEEITKDVKDMKDLIKQKKEQYYRLESEISSYEWSLEILELQKKLEV